MNFDGVSPFCFLSLRRGGRLENMAVSRFALVALAALAFLFAPTPARADCTQAVGAVCDGTACGSVVRPEGTIQFNADFNVYQTCSNGEWREAFVFNIQKCPNGFWYGEGKCYRQLNDIVTWTDARINCQALGADLVTLNSTAEKNLVRDNVWQFQNTWIGYTDAAVEGTWTWLDTSSSYTFWLAGDPNGGAGENCGFWEWDDNGRITDHPCGNTNYPLCEAPPQEFVYNYNDCPNGYYRTGEKCYRMYPAEVGWDQARLNCQADGADLMTVNNAQEAAALEYIRGGQDVWVGYTDAAVEGTWVWLDTSSTYTDWRAGEPNGGAAHDCGGVAWDGAGEFQDFDCAQWRYPICEAPLKASPISSPPCIGPADCPVAGDTCSDGTDFAGCAPPSNKPFFVTRCDAGKTWNGSSCTGTRSTAPWNNGNATGLVDTPLVDNYGLDGKANTATLVATDSDSVTGGVQPHQAAAYCDQLTIHGKSDWFMISSSEAFVLSTNYSAFDDLYPWEFMTSTEADTSGYRMLYMDNASIVAWNKQQNYPFRCGRRND